MEREKNRSSCCTLVIAVSGWLILGGAITYLEIKRNMEINPLAKTVNHLLREVDQLRAAMLAIENNTNYRLDLLEKKEANSFTTGDVDEYYDEFDDDYDEGTGTDDAGTAGTATGTLNGKSGAGVTGRRRRRSFVDKLRGKRQVVPHPLIGNSPNAIVRQAWAKPGNKSREGIEAEIIVNTHRALEPPPAEIWNPQQQPNSACCKPIVAHFEGDLSTPSHFKTSHHQGNHRVYQSGVISEWEPAKWMQDMGLTSAFNLDNGRSEVSIKEESEGLYFVYAQVFYADPHDIAGFGIYVNHENVFQCTVTSLHQAETHRQRNKSNSCYTGGLVRLTAGDKITLREIEGTRSTVMHAPKSFIGMFRVHAS